MSSIFHGFLLILLADVGDKTWGLVVAFTVWCPWCGLREAQAALMSMSYLLILLGCTGVLMFRCFLLAMGVDPFAWDGFAEVAASLLLLFVAARATIDFSNALTQRNVRRDRADQPLHAATSGARSQQASIEDDDPEVTRGYGATPKLVVSPDGPQGWTEALLTALFLPSLAVLFAEAGDRSQGALRLSDFSRLDVSLGAMAGFFVSCLLAIIIGHYARWLVSELWQLFAVNVALWVVCLCCARDGLLRLVLGALLPAAA